MRCPNVFSAIFVFCVALSACDGEGKNDPAPGGAAPQAPPARSIADTGLTGALSEDAFVKLHELSKDEAPAPRGTTVTLPGGSSAYLALPRGKDAAPPFSGVIVIHEWWGLNDHIRHWSDRLAEDGYAALAVDLYGGKVATTPEEAMAAMRTVDDDKARAILTEAQAFLTGDPRVQARKTASIGWCFGGGQSLQAALALPELDAAVIYYGRLVTDPERLKAIRAPLCCMFGTKDTSIPQNVIDEFDAALTQAGVPHEIHRYDAEHAFANPSSNRYDRAAAGAAWAEVHRFLAEHLKS